MYSGSLCEKLKKNVEKTFNIMVNLAFLRKMENFGGTEKVGCNKTFIVTLYHSY